jgi:hypothetical protein
VGRGAVRERICYGEQRELSKPGGRREPGLHGVYFCRMNYMDVLEVWTYSRNMVTTKGAMAQGMRR